MRVCQIGAVSATLVPKHKARRVIRSQAEADVATDDAVGANREKCGSSMSFVPARKGGFRMERLRRYSHRAMAMLLETDPDVLWWTSETEPRLVHYDGQDREVLPHFVVHRKAERQAIRISRIRRSSATALGFLAAATMAYAGQNVHYSVVRECDLLADPRLPASQSILWHRAWEVPSDLAVRTAALAATPPRTLGDLHEFLGGGASTWPLVISLVAHGWVDVDRSSDIGPGTIVHACKMGDFQ